MNILINLHNSSHCGTHVISLSLFFYIMYNVNTYIQSVRDVCVSKLSSSKRAASSSIKIQAIE